ncbi:class I SAM-dependent DNA methyltransferase [Roseobacter sp. HKCCA0434]|uniref:class I SAM-dependent DNA methyltransferase n=1 Tax=Roseobacter sp. HKCCA0434 TaxID=3079297 RepID=UPI002905F06C|nr:methyltransferase domain-containing protein [Roseobacter sp. HKCCA0434]
MTQRFLDKAYRDDTDMDRLYSDWAESYDAELEASGYASPRRCAEALAACDAPTDGTVLDFGCGTGLSGGALKRAGFETLDGCDVNADMLAKARERGIYRNLHEIAPGSDGLPGPTPDSIAAIGVIAPGHAPPETIDLLLGALPSGGRLVFSLNDHALAARSFEARIGAWTDSGSARCLFREHGPHIPAEDLGATVYVLQKG